MKKYIFLSACAFMFSCVPAVQADDHGPGLVITDHNAPIDMVMVAMDTITIHAMELLPLVFVEVTPFSATFRPESRVFLHGDPDRIRGAAKRLKVEHAPRSNLSTT